MLGVTGRVLLVAMLVLTTLGYTAGAGAWAASTVDQSQETSAGQGGFAVYAGQHIGQTFTAGRTGYLDQVDLLFNVQGASPLQLELRSVDAEGKPSTGEPLDSATVEAESPNGGWVSVALTTHAKVIEGQPYAIVATTTGNWNWEFSDSNPYAGGIAYFRQGSVNPWFGLSNHDVAFRTYVEPAIDADEDGHDNVYDDCDDTDPSVNPSATETYNQVDDDCDGATDEGFSTTSTPAIRNATTGAKGNPLTATARWTAPTNDGGSPVTGYIVRAKKLNESGVVIARIDRAVGPSARSLAVKLTAGRYKFRVRAVHGVGQSARSGNSNIVKAR